MSPYRHIHSQLLLGLSQGVKRRDIRAAGLFHDPKDKTHVGIRETEAGEVVKEIKEKHLLRWIESAMALLMDEDLRFWTDMAPNQHTGVRQRAVLGYLQPLPSDLEVAL